MKFKLESKRLFLRNLLDSDLDDFLDYRSKPEICRFQGFDPFDRKQAADFIESQTGNSFGIPGKWLQLAIVEKTLDRLIGDCAVRLLDRTSLTAELGCTIAPTFQQKGYAREAMLCLMQFLFEKQEVHRIIEATDTENVSSIKLLESIGFRLEGHFKENTWFKGKWTSEYKYAMLKKEWDVLVPVSRASN